MHPGKFIPIVLKYLRNTILLDPIPEVKIERVLGLLMLASVACYQIETGGLRDLLINPWTGAIVWLLYRLFTTPDPKAWLDALAFSVIFTFWKS